MHFLRKSIWLKCLIHSCYEDIQRKSSLHKYLWSSKYYGVIVAVNCSSPGAAVHHEYRKMSAFLSSFKSLLPNENQTTWNFRNCRIFNAFFGLNRSNNFIYFSWYGNLCSVVGENLLQSISRIGRFRFRTKWTMVQVHIHPNWIPRTCVEKLKDNSQTVFVRYDSWNKQLQWRRECKRKNPVAQYPMVSEPKLSWKKSNKNIDNMLGACSSSIFVS